MRYGIVIEKSETGYGAYAPDLPGCGVVASTADEAERLIQEAIEFHVEGLREAGEQPPKPAAILKYIDTRVA